MSLLDSASFPETQRIRAMPDVLFVLSPPRSFSSVVSTMIGQHPQMYGFPELHLFRGETLGEVVRMERLRRRLNGPPGLLRLLAEVRFGGQAGPGVRQAAAWVHDNVDRDVADVFREVTQATWDHLGEHRVVVEKSPGDTLHLTALERQVRCFPKARYLHLTRHPMNNRSSLTDFLDGQARRRGMGDRARVSTMEPILGWALAHRNILEVTRLMAPGQVLRVKGEDVLSDPDRTLPQIAEWLGLRTDAEAIEAMKHPETSPYAWPGPPGARGGNDGKFMRSPALRPGRVSQGDLAAAIDGGEIDQPAPTLASFQDMAHQLGYA